MMGKRWKFIDLWEEEDSMFYFFPALIADKTDIAFAWFRYAVVYNFKEEE